MNAPTEIMSVTQKRRGFEPTFPTFCATSFDFKTHNTGMQFQGNADCRRLQTQRKITSQSYENVRQPPQRLIGHFMHDVIQCLSFVPYYAFPFQSFHSYALLSLSLLRIFQHYHKSEIEKERRALQSSTPPRTNLRLVPPAALPAGLRIHPIHRIPNHRRILLIPPSGTQFLVLPPFFLRSSSCFSNLAFFCR